MHDIDVLFFDVGGVLGTNGWDHEQRMAAIAKFGLDEVDFMHRHHDAAPPWEEGRITLNEYLDLTVFWQPRPFSREVFVEFMYAQSEPFPEAIALVRRIHATRRYRLMTLNNESRELNQYRIAHFGLAGVFDAFLSSCYLAVRKPVRTIYERVLAIAHVAPPRAIFIDDREQNLAPMRALGVHTIQATSPATVEQQLAKYGVAVPAGNP